MIINNITLNFFDNYVPFYEWNKQDNIETINNVKLYKIKSNVLYDFIKYKIEIKNININNKICLFTDGYSYLALEFDKDNKSIYKSSLLLKDEEKIGSRIPFLNNTKIEYKKLSKDKLENELRVYIDAKKIISIEMNNIINENNIDKLKYYYYEWFEKNDDIEVMKKNISKRLNENLSNKELYIYDLIKRSYKMV